jgi:hypothetical protein
VSGSADLYLAGLQTSAELIRNYPIAERHGVPGRPRLHGLENELQDLDSVLDMQRELLDRVRKAVMLEVPDQLEGSCETMRDLYFDR